MTELVSRATRALPCVLLVVALAVLPSTTSAEPAAPLSTPDSYLAALQLIEQQHAVGEAQAAFLAAPAQRAEREASRTENSDETAHEAAATLTDEFSGAIKALDWTGTRLAQDGSYDAFLSDYVARVTIDGRHQLVESTLPLRVPDDTGKLAPVDLSLDHTSSGLEPANPITDVHLPANLGDGIKLGEGATALRIAPADAAGASEAVKVDDNAALYANTSTDTDFVAAPITTGAETFLQLRSPDAPEVSRLKIEAGGSLALAKLATGQVEVRVDGNLVARIAPPWAQDAQGKQIPVEMTIDGTDLILTVRHHDADVAYPILVDPTIDNKPADDWYNGGASGGSWFRGNRAGLEQWNYSENPAGWYPHGTYCVSNTDCALGAGGYNGLYSYSYAGAPYTTASNHFSEWYYRPYDMTNRTTYISRAEYAYVWNLWHGAANFYLWFGIQGAAPTSSSAVNTAATALPQVSNGYVVINGGSGGTTTNTSLGKVAVFAALPTPNTTHPGAGTYYVGGAVIFLDDTDTPGATVTHTTTPPTGWVKDYDDTATIAGHDGGLGIRAFSIGDNNNFSATSYQPMVGDATTTCDGSNTRPCYTDRNYPYHYTAADLGTGAHTLQGCTWDALWKTSCTTWQVKIDRRGPITTVGGTTELGTSGGTLTVSATDAETGVRTLRASTTDGDGNPVELGTLAPACSASGCPTDSDPLNISIDPRALKWAGGGHAVTVDATDFLGNASSQVTSISVSTPSAASICADEFSDDSEEFSAICLHDLNGDEEVGEASAIGSEEERACAAIWWRCRQWYKDSRTALKMAERLFTGKVQDSDSTKTNAFQHSFWVAQMVNSTDGSTLEVNGAYGLAIAYEEGAYNSSSQIKRNRSRSDVLNDRMGWNTGKRDINHSDQYICDELFDEAWYRSDLIAADQDPYSWYDQYGLGQLIYRKIYTYNTHIKVQPTGLDCTGANS